MKRKLAIFSSMCIVAGVAAAVATMRHQHQMDQLRERIIHSPPPPAPSNTGSSDFLLPRRYVETFNEPHYNPAEQVREILNEGRRWLYVPEAQNVRVVP